MHLCELFKTKAQAGSMPDRCGYDMARWPRIDWSPYRRCGRRAGGLNQRLAVYAASVSITVKIIDVSGNGRVGATTMLEGVSSRITLGDLVRTRVREEVARFNAAPQPVFTGLVMPEGGLATEEGFRLPKQRRLDWERQADRAIEAFERNGFFVLVDDRQVTELDEELELTADSDIRFVRLVQLVGG